MPDITPSKDFIPIKLLIDGKIFSHLFILFFSTFQILIEIDHLQDVPNPYLQIKGVNKETVVAAGSTLKLEGSYTTKVELLLHLPVVVLQIDALRSLAIGQ